MNKKNMYETIKRIFDIVISIISIIVLAPVFVITGIAIKLETKGPIIYKQTRIGKDGKEFKMYKFRSMNIHSEEKLKELLPLNEASFPAFKMDKDPRVTKVGKIIRRKSVDELPQLINVILGNMSIVGPRPPLPSEVKFYNEYQKQRLSIKPGLTCYWQCMKDRKEIPFDKWVELDLKYIKNRNLFVDLKIILKTFKVVLFQ